MLSNVHWILPNKECDIDVFLFLFLFKAYVLILFLEFLQLYLRHVMQKGYLNKINKYIIPPNGYKSRLKVITFYFILYIFRNLVLKSKLL